MANYLKKQEKRKDVEVFYAVGEDDDFKRGGMCSWKISKKLDFFSWKSCEVAGEYSDGKIFSKVAGVNKKKWKTEKEA
jgi:hypothetical protein